MYERHTRLYYTVRPKWVDALFFLVSETKEVSYKQNDTPSLVRPFKQTSLATRKGLYIIAIMYSYRL